MSIQVKDLSYVYSPGTPYAATALDKVSVTIDEGDFLGIVGKTGSGKSTFIQHLNALIKLQSGSIKVFDIDLTAKKPDLKRLRGTVGMVMQYPEYQLVDETVEKDVAYGPKNLGLSEGEIKGRVREAIELVGLSYDEVADRSPFELSGGQKRRVAIAGVIAMKPKVLILDEPTAGLDPRGKKDILALIKKLKETSSPTVIIISHDMDAVAENCDKVTLFSEGKIAAVASPRDIFYDDDLIKRTELDCPAIVKVVKEMKQRGVFLEDRPVTEEEFLRSIGRWRCE